MSSLKYLCYATCTATEYGQFYFAIIVVRQCGLGSVQTAWHRICFARIAKACFDLSKLNSSKLATRLFFYHDSLLLTNDITMYFYTY